MNLKLLAALLLLSAASAYCQKPFQNGDSVVYRDTLIESRYEVEHTPLRAGFEWLYGKAWYSQNTGTATPAPMSLQGCDFFSDGNGVTYGLRLLAEIPFWGDNSRWSFEPVLYGKLQNGTFDWLEQTSALDPATFGLTTVTIDHQLFAAIWEAGLEASMDYRLVGALSVRAGPSVGMTFSRSFSKSVHLVEPGHTFRGSDIRDSIVASGELVDNLRFVPGISAGVSYEFPLSHKLRVQPSLEFTLPLRGITPYWNGYQILGGIRFLFDLTPREETVPVFVKKEIPVVVHRPIDTVVPPRAELYTSIRAVAVSRNGDTSNIVKMRVEEVRTRSALPILNYIFFEDGSSKLPDRYVQYATQEDAARYFQGSTERHGQKLMDLYLETLNILGDRLRRYPKSNLTLIGTTSNVGRENNNIALARSRAATIKEYLVRIWNIDPRRIRVDAKLIPDRPSPLTTASGQEENRRVEFRVDDEQVTDPIMVTNIEHLATPDRIVLKPTIDTRHGVLKTFAQISAGGAELLSIRGDATSSTADRLWAPTEETLSKLRDSLELDFDVWDSAGNHAHASNSVLLDVRHVTSDRAERVERFSLILFGFDESHLERRNEREIRKAAEMIPNIPVERILIQGFTDETGESQHNDALSEDRALGVRKRLEEMLEEERASIPGDLHTEGRGSRDLYDNTLPEGRFFSRTVNITIQRSAK